MRSRTQPPLIKPGKTVILVGNGPCLMHSEKGKHIDRFDEVFRFNQFRVKGFERHVGSKTTVYCTFGRGILPGDIEQRTEKVLLTFAQAKPAFEARWMYPVPRSYYRELTNEIEAASQMPKPRRLQPSSGYLVARWLLDTGQTDHVTLAGFDHFSREKDGRHHYWIPRRFGRPKEHDGEVERQSLAAYVQQGRIEYLT